MELAARQLSLAGLAQAHSKTSNEENGLNGRSRGDLPPEIRPVQTKSWGLTNHAMPTKLLTSEEFFNVQRSLYCFAARA